ncbi:MAG: hypothetical protein JWM32_286 [Verrucomicrobia bacterium]|nr:hypothetical protein [Verrucomicrobiota bacterium]
MAPPRYVLHLETPVDAPGSEEFPVRGWIASEEPIHAVAAGEGTNRWLHLADRPDVRQAWPTLSHVAGFSGMAARDALRGDRLVLLCRIGDEQIVVGHELNPSVLPPPHLQVRQVGGDWGKNFFVSGGEMFDQIAAAAAEFGKPLGDAERILDFGCGCGRVLKSFARFPHRGEVWGSDIDPEAIAWNRGNLGDVALFDCNATVPPLAFPDAFFDFIFSVSVFTHLPEEMQLAWVAELRRVLKPGGMLIASLHGERYWSADPGVKAEVVAKGYAYRTGPVTAGLPEFYMSAFHSEAYIRAKWSEYFEVLAVKPAYIHGVHDAAILRRG